jgi:gluconolactonase
MGWTFEPVAGPFGGAIGGLVWDGQGLLVSVVAESRILRLDGETAAVTEARRWTNRTSGLAIGPDGRLFGCQEGSRRIVEFRADGSAGVLATRLDGRYHNFPSDVTVGRDGTIWFADPYNPVPAFGPQLFPPLPHASVLRLGRDHGSHKWVLGRATHDTAAPRAVLPSADERTLYVAEGDVAREGPRELRAYPLDETGRLGPPTVLHSFGVDHRGPHRGIEGMCLAADGDILACGGWRQAGPGPLLHVFAPSGAIRETHELPDDLPTRCAFGGSDRATLYLGTAGGMLYRATDTGRRGFDRFAAGEGKR